MTNIPPEELAEILGLTDLWDTEKFDEKMRETFPELVGWSYNVHGDLYLVFPDTLTLETLKDHIKTARDKLAPIKGFVFLEFPDFGDVLVFFGEEVW